jgi:hypothetical protein
MLPPKNGGSFESSRTLHDLSRKRLLLRQRAEHDLSALTRERDRIGRWAAILVVVVATDPLDP